MAAITQAPAAPASAWLRIVATKMPAGDDGPGLLEARRQHER